MEPTATNVFKTTDAPTGCPFPTGQTYGVITALAIDPTRDETVYAASFSGVFKTNDEGTPGVADRGA